MPLPPCSVCKRKPSIAFFDKWYCGACLRIRGHESEFRKLTKKLKQHQLEDIMYYVAKKIEDYTLEKPKRKEPAYVWTRIFSKWKSRTESMLLFSDDNGAYHLQVYGGVHKVVFHYEDKMELLKDMRKMLVGMGIKPYGQKKNGRARFYI